jgi:CBS domain-containing protein
LRAGEWYKGSCHVHSPNILEAKGHEVWKIAPDDMVVDAIREMARRDVGALVVFDESGPIGIFTERHYARNVFLKGRSSPKTPVREAMRSGFVYVTPERTVEECMALMTEHKIRHLPVIEGGNIAGIISMGDLARSIIADQEFTIDQLSNYIAGSR